MSRSQFEFLRRVRIHGGECGAVARALHHEVRTLSSPAAFEKVSIATKERKVMSKKTFFKRIAVTAIVALGIGGFSAIPSQATVTAHTLSIDAATDSITLGESATAVLNHSFVNLGSAQDSVTLRAVVTSSNATTAGTVYLSVTDSFTSQANTAVANVSPEYAYPGTPAGSGTGGTNIWDTDVYGAARDSVVVSHIDSADRSVGTTFQLKLYNPTAAGTYTVSVYTQTSAGGSATLSSTGTPTVTWTVTVTGPDRVATAASTVTMRDAGTSCTSAAASGTAEATDSTILTAATALTTDTTPEAVACVRLKNATNTAQESIIVTVSGEAYVTLSGVSTRPTATTGSKSGTFPAANIVDEAADPASATIVFWSTGTPGTATATFSTVGGVSLGSKTMTFHGDVTKLEISTALYKIARSAGGAWVGNTSTGSAFTVKATDAGGRAVKGLTISTVSSDATVLTGGDTCVDARSGYTTDGVYSCQATSATGSVSGAKATLTIRTVDPAVTTSTAYITTTYEMSLGGAIASEVVTLDKATYEPGEAMKITVTAKDASGNPVYDGQAAPTFSANKAVGGSFTSLMSVYLGGVSTSEARLATNPNTVTNTQTIFAPAASGKFVITGTGGDAAGTILSVTGTVGDDAATTAASAATDAALEAIDAANAATDAANLAAEAADAATVAAEEARDAADAATAAVEALATEVATLMAALKAQITTLANTVAKIAKRVRA